MQNEEVKGFCKRLKNLMKKKNIKRKDLAEILRCSSFTIDNYCSRSYPDCERLMKLCDILDCSADYLLFGKITYQLVKKRKDKHER